MNGFRHRSAGSMLLAFFLLTFALTWTSPIARIGVAVLWAAAGFFLLRMRGARLAP